MSNRLTNYIEKLIVLSLEQYRFREKPSTELALLRIQDLIINALDNKVFSFGIFLDFAKAFGSVDDSILIRKLRNYGVRGPLQWFKKYLQDILQQVQCSGGVLSELFVKISPTIANRTMQLLR